MEIINILAIVIAPIASVIIAQNLQNRSEKRKDKMQIFKTLMTARIYGWTTESVNALNVIDIIFVNDKKVREAWKNLLDAYSSTEQSELIVKKRQDLMNKLIETIANNLGYKNKITWETIQNPYMPKGMMEAIKQQYTIQSGQEKLAAVVDRFANVSGLVQSSQSQSDDSKNDQSEDKQ